MMTESQIRAAISEGRLVPFFQPIHHALTGDIQGCEVLARIKGVDTDDILTPDRFISIVEDSDLLMPFTLTLIDSVRHFIKVTGMQFPYAFYVSFNVPVSILCRPSLKIACLNFMKTTPPEVLLVLEITERQKMDLCESDLLIVRDLKKIGARLWLDDFGVGYSSAELLETGIFDGVKVPYSIIWSAYYDDILRQGINERTLICNMLVIVEEVEDISQFRAAQDKNAILIQGYYFSKALNTRDFFTYMNKIRAYSIK
ncbi:EAL domain-containing protein [Citrobacter meridianamericanus]|uniref:EAL domain-containing protein n=1 Tax=Citrobacter meridianamericanus TaxID=2894201 RepID=UPI00351CC6DA